LDSRVPESGVESIASELYCPTNKDRLCERSEPRSYPVVEQARTFYKEISFYGDGKKECTDESGFFESELGR
jgi:hypothetical protein